MGAKAKTRALVRAGAAARALVRVRALVRERAKERARDLRTWAGPHMRGPLDGATLTNPLPVRAVGNDWGDDYGASSAPWETAEYAVVGQFVGSDLRTGRYTRLVTVWLGASR